ncbi:MAG: SDR family NAD(P)-dependent oxidoreductase [Crocinitomicaceae bacterium]
MNKTIFITGATAGFGKATAQLFAKKKWDLVLTGRRKERLEVLKQELEKEGVKVTTLNFDVRDFEDAKKSIESLPKDITESIAVLVNNAGLAAGKDSIDEGKLDDWNLMIDTNIKGLLNVSKLVIPILKENKSGHIINIGSIAGKDVYPKGNVYCATKFAVDALTQSMRIDLLPYNIKVSNVAPGAADTEFSNVRFKGDKQLAADTYKGYSPLLAQDIAETIEFIVNRPAHVMINEIVIMPSAQASSNHFFKK